MADAFVQDTVSGDETAAHLESTTSAPAKLLPKANPRAKSTACRRCHSRKVKCAGGQPCGNCRRAGKVADCIYPRRNRLVKISQRYMDDLVAENERLRGQVARNNDILPSSMAVGPSEGPQQNEQGSQALAAAQAPSLDERPWFFDLDIPHTPILIGEASDAAFATRFRQAVCDGHLSHIPRVNYATDESLLALSDTECDWPSPSRARFLVDVALRYVSRYYHIVRRTTIMEGLEQTLRNPARSSDSLLRSKLWALFAIGEMYSSRSAAGAAKGFPGIHYFARATRVLRIVSERPRIDAIEIRLLLSFYSLALNRRHSAYTLAGSAVRLSVVMGLHLNVPLSHLSDVAVREHRRRVWWTAYVFDRLWASKLGNPAAIDDVDIRVDLPSDQPTLEGTTAEADFADTAYLLARIRLARLAGSIIQSIYGRRIHNESLSQRVQQALRDLRVWVEELPGHLHIDAQGPGNPEMVPKPLSLHLSFNQCVVNATRPILLYVLRTHAVSWARTEEEAAVAIGQSEPVSLIPAVAMTVAETCIRCARHSVRLLIEAWIDGSFATFNYFYTQYLFSAATILAISSLLPIGTEKVTDGEKFEAAASILLQLKSSGSFAGEEFCRHIEAMKAAMEKARLRQAGEPSTASRSGSHHGVTRATVGEDAGSDRSAVRAESGNRGADSGAGNLTQPVSCAGPDQHNIWTAQQGSTSTALWEPSLHQFLAQPAVDLQLMDASIIDNVSFTQGLYWPDVTPSSGLNAEPWTAT